MSIEVNRRQFLGAATAGISLASLLTQKELHAKENNTPSKPPKNQNGSELSPLEFTALTVGGCMVIKAGIAIAEDICDERRAAQENARIEKFTQDYRRQLAMEDHESRSSK